MFNIHSGVRYFLYQGYADMRKSFHGLCGIVTNELHQDIMSGDVFIFLNKRKTHIKLLVWEGDGFAIYYKRLEQGTYEFPSSRAVSTDIQTGKGLVITYNQLLLILQGISLGKVHYRKRYKRVAELSASG